MDTLIVKKCSRLNLLKLIKKYSTARYREAGDIVERFYDAPITIEAEEDMVVNLDGEIFMDKTVKLELVHNGVNLLCPIGIKFFDIEREFASISK